MGALDNLMLSLDETLTSPLSQWNTYTTALAGLLAAGVTYAVVSSVEPDTHPLRLARQSLPNLVRQEGESAFYRSAELGGGELRTGLEVRKKGESKWSRGRNGDLRDVWRSFVDGSEDGTKGKLLTVHGARNVAEHKIGKEDPLSLVYLDAEWGSDANYASKRTSRGRLTSSASTSLSRAVSASPSTSPTASSSSSRSSRAPSTRTSRRS